MAERPRPPGSDRDHGPALLRSLSDLSEYHASTADLEVTVDLSDLDARSVEVAEGRKLTVTVPHARLGVVALDLERSKVVARRRGLVNRVTSVFSENPTSEQGAQIAGRRKLVLAAAESDLRARAERNTRIFLTRILRSAGASEVTVVFADSPM